MLLKVVWNISSNILDISMCEISPAQHGPSLTNIFVFFSAIQPAGPDSNRNTYEPYKTRKQIEKNTKHIQNNLNRAIKKQKWPYCSENEIFSIKIIVDTTDNSKLRIFKY